MPRPRFNKLPLDRRERILRAAAREFGTHNYEAASLNRILEQAGLSKGAAYYYFDDKADLYQTVVQHYLSHLTEETSTDLAALRADTFWPALHTMYRRQLSQFLAQPWMLGVARSVASAPKELLTGPLAPVFQQLRGWLREVLRRGRELDLVRTDLPEELLISLIIALDEASDRWLMQCWGEELGQEVCERHASQIVDNMRRLLSPAPAP